MSLKPTFTQVVPIENILPRRICQDPKLIDEHVAYWLNHMPDMTDLPTIDHKQLQFWMKQKKKDRTKAHRKLQGLKASWTNASIDFVISQNRWPVVFEDDEGRIVDLVEEFVLIFWVSYVRHMVRDIRFVHCLISRLYYKPQMYLVSSQCYKLHL